MKQIHTIYTCNNCRREGVVHSVYEKKQLEENSKKPSFWIPFFDAGANKRFILGDKVSLFEISDEGNGNFHICSWCAYLLSDEQREPNRDEFNLIKIKSNEE